MSDTPEGNICKVSANLGWASDTLAEVDKALLKLSAEVKTILRERDNFQDQRDFAMGELERLRKERDEARKENEEQARLLGKGSEREARLTTERDHYKQALSEMFNSINEWNESMVKEPADNLIAAINHKINNVLNG